MGINFFFFFRFSRGKASQTLNAMSEPTIEKYLEVCHQFFLGKLTTECSNPITANLSQLCADPSTLPKALEALQQVDVSALETLLRTAVPATEQLARDVHETLLAGKKVVCEGCGATGRLSLSLEVFAREGMVEEAQYQDKIIGFMAGGDAALIRSIEQFEDKVEFGKRQLHAVNFEDGDLLLAITEGGETPFVIAACEEALVVSPSRAPYFLYCNPDDILAEVERSHRVITNPKIKKINLCVGPMAITGSTRMQATTVQILVAGLAIRHHAHPDNIRGDLEALLSLVKSMSYGVLAPFTAKESELYLNKEYFLYETDYFSVTVMTDTTERAPTFSLPPFESYNNPTELASPVYLTLPGVTGAEEGWTRLLRRAPRPLEWEESHLRTGIKAILGYDFSKGIEDKRRLRLGEEKTRLRAVVAVEPTLPGMSFAFPHCELKVMVPFTEHIAEDRLLINVMAKMLLNAHSTAVMGVLQRYEGNVMTWVRPSNNKLIDRAARYVKLLVTRRMTALGADEESIAKALPSYAQICTRIYELRETVPTDQPIVLILVDEIMGQVARN